MAFVEDLTPFFSDFGDDGVLSGQPVRGLLDNPVRELCGNLGGGIVATEVSFLLPEAQVPSTIYGAALTVLGVNYTVRESLPDGNGLARLFLTNA